MIPVDSQAGNASRPNDEQHSTHPIYEARSAQHQEGNDGPWMYYVHDISLLLPHPLHEHPQSTTLFHHPFTKGTFLLCIDRITQLVNHLKAPCYALSELKAENLYHAVKDEMARSMKK